MTVTTAPLLEKKDIQGLVARSYQKLKAARFVLLQITDPAAVKKYLKTIADEINTIAESPEHFALQIAFTSAGLKKIGIPDAAWHSFSREFLEGMTEPFRALILGDQNENHPDKWVWGGPGNSEVHIMMLCYAKDTRALEEWFSKNDFSTNGMSVIKIQETTEKLPKSKEHFGFRDGISKPVMNGFSEPKPGDKNINAGEFVLGYPNEYNVISERPVVNVANDPHDLLPVCEDSGNAGCKDLGRNGSYMVYRQMTQYVYRFWKYLADNSKEEPASTPVEAAIKLGAKMVGRWPGGAPMATSPETDDPAKAEQTDFTYSTTDPDGMGCPFGAHVRRTNPRDQLFDRPVDASAEMIRKHQLLRRGRSYGNACVETMDPAQVLEAGEDGCDRGLHFICLVSNLSRQFEFVQNVWAQGPTFNGLYNDGDPLIGTRQAPGAQLLTDQFTCPATPLRRKYKEMPQFTNVVGGAYFFLPGIRALKYIANC